MDQIKIGKFIAKVRKEKNMTQQQLADFLSISHKTVSKWECGNGLPEVSLMLPLCEKLEISVNELLTGAKVSEQEYRKKAEENMMNLVQENQENKKNMALSIICGIVTIIAVVSLTVIASYIKMHIIARIAILILAFLVAVLGTSAALMIDVKAGYYECPNCKEHFVPTMHDYVKGYHTLTKRKLTCPHCQKTLMCRHKITR